MKVKKDFNLDNLSSLENNIAKLYRTNIIQPLKGFCRVVEEGNLSRAAEKYGVTPGLLTKQIKVIENQLGIELFNRDNNCRIFPNEAGLKFYDRASKIISQLENLVVEFSEKIDEEESRTLRIGTNSFFFSKITDIVDEIRKIKPYMKLSIDVLKQDEAIVELRENRLDLFVSNLEYEENEVIDLQFTKLSDYVPYWVLWKGHPLENKEELTKNDLINCNMVFDDKDITMDSLKTFIKDNRIKSHFKVNNITISDYLSSIKNKLGIWIIFNTYLNNIDKENFVFKKATNLFPTGEYGCFTKKTCKPIVKKTIELLLNLKSRLFSV